MRRSLSSAPGSFSAPNQKEESGASDIERDHILNQLTQDQYERLYQMVWNVAYLIVGHPLEADIVADKAIAALEAYTHLPSPSQIEKHLRVLARSRAFDCLESPMHRFRMHCRALIHTSDEAEEYEVVPALQSSLGAEETFFYEQDRQLFAQHFAHAVSCLSDLQRVCFVLRFVEQMKPEEIAQILHVSVDTVYTQTYRARNRVARLLTASSKEMKYRERSPMSRGKSSSGEN